MPPKNWVGTDTGFVNMGLLPTRVQSFAALVNI